jgi:outer membrane autotransporter protein
MGRSGGGGGGANGFSGASLTNSNPLVGGNGGDGGGAVISNYYSQGGGGGGGADGAFINFVGQNYNSSQITGGNGGAGGGGGYTNSGNGGNGGNGSTFQGGLATFETSGSVKGGNGGNGGTAIFGNYYGTLYPANGGNGGNGGVGVTMNSGTIQNSGTIVGGDGGVRGLPLGSGVSGANGSGGAGISGSNLIVYNSGTISGGLGGDGVTRADAITFVGGANRLTITPTSNIIGRVSALGTIDTLIFSGEGTATFDIGQLGAVGSAAQYQGFENFNKIGGGTWLIEGDNSAFTGNTVVSDGKFVVGDDAHPNAVLGGTLNVQPGATLGGFGTVGTTTISADATLAPGNSIGTLHVNGDLNLNSDSIYAVEVGGGTSDKTVVSGTATVSGAFVQVSALDPSTSYQTTQTYTILTAGTAVVGSFAGATPTAGSAFLDISLTYDANDVFLLVGLKPVVANPSNPTAAPRVFETVANTRNEFNTAVALDTLRQSGPSLGLYNSLLLLDATSARTAFNDLSGEIHASVKSGLVDDSHFTRDAITDRIRAAFGEGGISTGAISSATVPDQKAADPDRFAFWTRGYGAWGNIGGDGNATKLDRSTGGLFVGADGLVADTWRVGFLGGYGNTSFDADGRSSSADVDSYTIGAYAGTKINNIGLRFGVANTWDNIDTTRSINFAGVSDTARSSYDGRTTQVFGEAGYTMYSGITSFEPFAGLAYVNVRTDGYNEGGTTGLHGGDDDMDSTFTTLGIRSSTDIALGGVTGSVKGTLGWRHAFGDTSSEATHSFAGSQAFTVAGVPVAQDVALIEAGFDMKVNDRATVGLSYQGQFGDGSQENGVNAALHVRF